MNDCVTEDWRVRGQCATRDPDLWFSTAGKNLREAKRLCSLCAVRKQCLAFAIESAVTHGVWGGMSEIERRSIPRAKRAECIASASVVGAPAREQAGFSVAR